MDNLIDGGNKIGTNLKVAAEDKRAWQTLRRNSTGTVRINRMLKNGVKEKSASNGTVLAVKAAAANYRQRAHHQKMMMRRRRWHQRTHRHSQSVSGRLDVSNASVNIQTTQPSTT